MDCFLHLSLLENNFSYSLFSPLVSHGGVGILWRCDVFKNYMYNPTKFVEKNLTGHNVDLVSYNMCSKTSMPIFFIKSEIGSTTMMNKPAQPLFLLLTLYPQVR